MKTNVKYHAIIFQIQCIQIQERVALKKKTYSLQWSTFELVFQIQK